MSTPLEIPTEEVDHADGFCSHGPTSYPITILVYGVPVPMDKAPFCAPCTERYMNLYSTTCQECHQPICRGMQVCAAGNGRVGVVHSKCGEAAGFLGTWGEGQVNLHPALREAEVRFSRKTH